MLEISIIPGKQIRIPGGTRRRIFKAITKGSYSGTKFGLQMMKEHYLKMNQRYCQKHFLKSH